MYNYQGMNLNQIQKIKNCILESDGVCVCVFLSQLNTTSFFNKLILTKVLGDYKVFK